MAKRASPRTSIGIKELKDQASSVIDEVQRRRRPVVITRNSRQVARIVPIETDPGLKLKELGLIALEPRESWGTLKLNPLKLDATAAVRAIGADREDD
jgi:prevent-host-death family protein